MRMKGIKNEPYGSFQLVENHKRKEFQSSAAACTSRSLLIFLEENLIFRKKNRFLAELTATPCAALSILVGVAVAGELAPSSTRLSKILF